jgi:heme-degrading monooxygenase HmoA
MHARVAAFENPRFGDKSLADELRNRARESAPRWQEELRNAQGHVMLVDADSGRGLGITFFGSEEDIRAAEPVFDRMGDEIPEEQRGRRTSVDVYEVGISEGGDDANAARVSRLEGDAGKIDESIRRSQDELLPQVRNLRGYKGAYSLHDRANGRTLMITFWENDEAMRSSEEQAESLRQQSAEMGGGRVADVERYQVMFANRLAEVGGTR